MIALDGLWDFAFLGDVDPESVDPASIAFADRMAVPGCFDATPAYAGRRGLTAYRTRVRIQELQPHRLVFDGVHHWCRIFWNGRALRDHAGGFTRFTADIDDPGEEAEIVVLVDNRFDDRRSPLHLEYFDWYHFGGISRSVELHRLGPVWIDRLRVATEDVDRRLVSLEIDFGCASPRGDVHLTVESGDQVILDEIVDLPATSGRLSRTVAMPWAEPWSPSSPALHPLRVRLGDDDMCERIGLRQVTVSGRRIAVNGEPVTLLGVNRHESHPQFGHAQPTGLLVADIQQILDLGCNFVRGSHYPQDPLFLDLCDEVGLCVWSESIGWQYAAERLTDPDFLAAQLEHIDEMVASSANHPSVIMWGVLNESPSHEIDCRPAYERLLGRLRELDGSRPVTYASNHVYEDQCLDLVDIVSVNCYPGWYVGGIADIPAELDRIAEHVDRSGHTDKPLIISEIGAGAIPGWRDQHHGLWTEEYQTELLETVIRHLTDGQDRVSGLSIWVLGDFRTSEAKGLLLGRPRSINDKGIVDEYRRPKQAYGAVRDLFRAARETSRR